MEMLRLRKQYYEEVYRYRPSWIVTNGLFLFFLIFLSLLVFTCFIKYPDLVTGTAVITESNPPSNLVSKVNGKIEKLLVSEGDEVKVGQVLCLLETPVNWNDINTVSKYIDVMDSCIKEDIIIPMDKYNMKLRLGELQTYYNNLLNSYNDYLKHFKFSYLRREIETKKQLLTAKNNYFFRQHQQLNLIKKVNKISEKEQARNRILYEKGLISAYEMEQSSIQAYQKGISQKDLELSMSSTQSEIRQYEYEISELLLKEREELQQYKLTVQQNISQLKSSIDTWKQNYVIMSPINGHVTYNTFWSENQNIKSGDIVMSVVPEDKLETQVRVSFPIANSGKVHNGQVVNIKLENYSYTEFGCLKGWIKSISKVPDANFCYTAEILLQKGLVTTYNKRLLMKNYLRGVAEIQTDDNSLLMRMFNPVRALFDNNVNG